MKYLTIFLIWIQSQIVLAADLVNVHVEGEPIPYAIPVIIGVIIAIQIALRGLAECLTRISVHTKTKVDNKIAKYLSEAAWILGVAIGKVGYSVPKLVTEEKVKKINEKGD